MFSPLIFCFLQGRLGYSVSFINGDICPSGHPRSINVVVECDRYTFSSFCNNSVTEIATCEYQAFLFSSAGCSEDCFESCGKEKCVMTSNGPQCIITSPVGSKESGSLIEKLCFLFFIVALLFFIACRKIVTPFFLSFVFFTTFIFIIKFDDDMFSTLHPRVVIALSNSSAYFFSQYSCSFGNFNSVMIIQVPPNPLSDLSKRINKTANTTLCSSEKLVTFVKYAPSDFETLWERNANNWLEQECSVLSKPTHINATQIWLDKSIPSSNPVTILSSHLLLNTSRDDIFSRMQYCFNGSFFDVGIEPLAGILRDPRSICSPVLDLLPLSNDVQSKDFLGLDAAHLRFVSALKPKRIFLFDIGCTRWNDKLMPGLRWLYDIFSVVGLTFTDIYGWEPSSARSEGFFDGLPIEVVSKMHFFNLAADTLLGSSNNPLEILALVAQPDDFVVFKLDIDTPDVELRIILEIIGSPRYSALIDELFFEHHVNIGAMRGWWGNEVDGTLQDSIHLFQSLRQVGIKAHAWP